MSEHQERFPVGPRGVQGAQGKQGEPGRRGLSPLQGRAVVVLFLIAALSGVGNLFWTGHDVNASQAAIQAAQHRDQAAQQRAGAQLGVKLCTTFGRLAALKPPAGSAQANPSRAYEQELHATLDELGTDLGCK